MCYVHLNEQQIKSIGRELTNEEWLEIARQAKDAGMLYLTLTGGEVFARPGFRELYEQLSQMGFLITILSNGYLIDENVMSWLSEMPPYILRFTLYGASNDTYYRVCGVKDGFDRVLRAIDLVKQADIPFYMVSTLVKENINDLKSMQDFANEKGVVINFSSAVLKPVRGATQDAVSHRLDISAVPDEVLQYMVSHGLDRIYPSTNHLFDVCKKYRKGFWLTWNGNLQLCSYISDPAIPLTANIGFNEAWKLLLERLDQSQKPEECKSCKYEGFCKKCPGILAAECGSCSAVSEDFCANAKYIYNKYLLMKGGIHK
jgi:radical SAM protein with 4Fe4S-binding SPASM domain